MSAYYNEIEPYAAQWLRNLIAKGVIANGEVDTRSIADVSPEDLRGFTQCHFFAGIGGWSHALRLAEWSDDRAIWTGSCPCQPFSVAGKGAGTDDPRHLWPHFHRLIRACRPPVVMGEQVAGKAGYGWFDGVRADLEADHYASRAVDISALAVNAPHIRQRLYWVACDMADTSIIKRNGGGCGNNFGAWRGIQGQARTSDSHMADLHQGGQLEPIDNGERAEGVGSPQPSRDSGGNALADAQSGGRRQGVSNARGMREGDGSQGSSGRPSQHGDAQPVHMADADNCGSFTQLQRDHRKMDRTISGKESSRDQSAICLTPRSTNNSFWSDHIWLTGSDGKSRRSKSGLPLLAYGIPNRVGRLRAYGNAIVAPLAAEVIKAFM